MKIIFLLLISTLTFSKSLELISYNVENLFDTQHDEGKEDWTFLPKDTKGKKEACKKIGSHYRRQECFEIDWTEGKLAIKLSQIKDVLLKERKTLPNILGLVEIENENVISKLAKVLGYEKFVVSNSPDKRGIDLALLYQESADLKFVSKEEHELKGDYFIKRPSRNILEVKFRLAGKYDLYVFVNHWPSLGNPDIAREIAANTLKTRFSEIEKTNKDALLLAMGDFNTIPKLKKKGNKHPFSDVLLVDSGIKDLGEEFYSKNKNNKNFVDSNPKGSYFYAREGEWNHLDRIFFNKNLENGKTPELDVSSYHIYAPEFINKYDQDFDDENSSHFKKSKKKEGTPNRYDHKARDKKTAGFSDHYPVIFKINY